MNQESPQPFPTAASWLNAVEGFFTKLTKRRLKRGVFCSALLPGRHLVQELPQAATAPRRGSEPGEKGVVLGLCAHAGAQTY